MYITGSDDEHVEFPNSISTATADELSTATRSFRGIIKPFSRRWAVGKDLLGAFTVYFSGNYWTN